MTTATIILEGPTHRLTSYGRGWADRLERKTDGRSVWVQDDDAATFWERLDAFEGAHMSMPTDDVLRHMLDEYAEAAQ